MSAFIKNDGEWCQLDPIQPNLDELRQAVAAKTLPWHPLCQGLKRTKCGRLVGGPSHPIVRDACPTCEDCIDADNVGV